MYYTIRELYKVFTENKKKSLGQIYFINGNMVENICEVFDKEVILESHPYYEFNDIYNHTIVTYTDGSYQKYYDDYVEVSINKTILKQMSKTPFIRKIRAFLYSLSKNIKPCFTRQTNSKVAPT